MQKLGTLNLGGWDVIIQIQRMPPISDGSDRLKGSKAHLRARGGVAMADHDESEQEGRPEPKLISNDHWKKVVIMIYLGNLW